MEDPTSETRMLGRGEMVNCRDYVVLDLPVQDMEKDEKMTPETKLFIKEGQTLLAYRAINSIFQDIFHLGN